MTPIQTCTLTPGCENPREGNTLGCASCNFAARKAEKQAKKMQIVRAPNKVSEKRSGQMQEYWKLRAEYLALYPVCEVEDCNLKSVEIHHQRGREGDKLLDTNFFMAVCHGHHVYYTEHSKEAIEKGVSVSRTTK